ncbi:MAG: type II toxin-antitoxin system HicA family toxin [Ignavibacteria bacterium]|nr:type II toxin-antitoxin system HicA family toxin [Ignavibacteria bacterium]
MPKPRQLSGDDVIAILSRFGFSIHSQRGSHVKLRRLTAEGTKQTLTIPRHKELGPGTVHAIFRQSSRYIPEDQLLPLFFF